MWWRRQIKNKWKINQIIIDFLTFRKYIVNILTKNGGRTMNTMEKIKGLEQAPIPTFGVITLGSAIFAVVNAWFGGERKGG
jgi:hypothetical protein